MRSEGVLVLGLDGGTIDIVGPLAERGVMPNLAGLLARGRSGVLRSTEPWYTIPGWASMNAGVAPERHGLLHWVVSDPSEYFENRRRGRRFVQSTDLGFPTYWDIASAAGRRVCVVNMPMTFPAWDVNGVMVAGFLTPAGAKAGVTSPPGVLDDFPTYTIEPASSLAGDMSTKNSVDARAYVREMIDITRARGTLASTLLGDDAALDLGVVVFVGLDRLAHKVWPDLSAILSGPGAPGSLAADVEEYFRTLDAAIGQTLAAAGEEVDVLLVSDHGFSAPPGQTFAVNAWLREQGYLRVRAARMQQAVARRKAVRRLVGRVARLVRRRRSAEYAGVDWSASTMYGVRFPRTRMFGLVVNRAGRKRDGIVADADVPALLARVQGELDALRNAHGDRVIRSVRPPEGVAVDGFPDLLVETTDGFDPIDGFRDAELFDVFDEPSGLHDRAGILVGAGPRLKPRPPDGVAGVDANIVDIAPTVLGLLGLLPPAALEGRAIDELFVFPERVAPPDGAQVTSAGSGGAGVSAEQEAEISAHLESLGYLD